MKKNKRKEEEGKEKADVPDAGIYSPEQDQQQDAPDAMPMPCPMFAGSTPAAFAAARALAKLMRALTSRGPMS
jgi:hypothetical protein